MKYYGSDKPDLRFGMKFVELMDIMKGHGFSVFDNAAYIGGICAEGAASYTRKQLDQLTEFVKRPQVGAKGMVYARVEADGNVKSSVDKFYSQEVLQEMAKAFNAKPGDLILILSGDDAMKTRKQLCELRLEMGRQLGLRDKDKFACLWVVDFPMFEWSEEEGRLMAMHHPFTHPKDEDIPLLDTDPAAVRADAYDMVVNGVEVGGGSIRIHDSKLQAKMFEILGFTPEKAQEQFGFLMNAFKYGARLTEDSPTASTVGYRSLPVSTQSATALRSRKTTAVATLCSTLRLRSTRSSSTSSTLLSTSKTNFFT